MTDIDINTQRAAFVRFLNERYHDTPRRQQSVLHMVEDELPDYARMNLDAAFTLLYAVTSLQTIEDYRATILHNPILRQEDEEYGELSLRNTLNIYRKFLQSRFNPLNGNYQPPVALDGENVGVHERQQELHEGAEVQGMHSSRYERSPEARQQCIDHYKRMHDGHIVCECCGFDFGKHYRNIGEGYIEIHHVVPVSQRGGDYVVNPETDLVPLCSNCHSMIHRIGEQCDCMTLQELKALLIDE